LESTLETRHLRFLAGPKSSYVLSEGRSRDLQKAVHIAIGNPFKVTEGSLTQLPWGNEDHFVGELVHEAALLILVQSWVDGVANLELRDSDNAVRLRSAPLSKTFKDSRLVATQGGHWLVYKNQAGDVSLEDEPEQAARLLLGPNKQITLGVPITSASDADAFISSSTDTSPIVVGLAKKSEENPFGTFRIANTREGTAAPLETRFILAPKKAVESWTATMREGVLHLAYVEGSSLLGTAELKLALISITPPGKLLSQTSSTLGHTHSGQLAWLSDATRLYLVVPRWLDQESTLAVYNTDQNGLTALGNWGVFEEGTKFQSFFVDPQGGSKGVITEPRSKLARNPNLCQLTAL
jgi:hypothetical protein